MSHTIETKPLKVAASRGGMVATAFSHATEAGAEMLRDAGNAVDAAVAAAFALGVCEPQASGIGGQTMMLISTGARTVALDGSSRAPSLASNDSISGDGRLVGYRATTVPSTPATLAYAQKRWGSLPLARVLEPAIRIATEGYRITDLQNRLQERELESFSRVPSGSGARYFLNGGSPWPVGALFKQPDLARTLRRLAEHGVEDFYQGEMARRIDADMRANDGLLRLDDLALIPWPVVRRTVRSTFRGFRVHTMPPPGAGRALVLALNMIDQLEPDFFRHLDPVRYQVLAEVFRKSMRVRNDSPFDPNLYAQVDFKQMRSRKFARRSLRRILKGVDRGLLAEMQPARERSGETTHLSTIDRNGMAVSLTQSIERVYGSKAAAAGLGFLYNNYVMDFQFTDPAHPFYLRPNSVPWATVAPTILTRDEKVWMAVGSPGSERIFSTITQFLTHVIDGGMNLEDAMRAPRMHCSSGGKISMEANRFDPRIVEHLEAQGYKLDRLEDYAFYLGAIHAVMRAGDGTCHGVAEARRDGSAGGPA